MIIKEYPVLTADTARKSGSSVIVSALCPCGRFHEHGAFEAGISHKIAHCETGDYMNTGYMLEVPDSVFDAAV